jgi:hypothetical protein
MRAGADGWGGIVSRGLRLGAGGRGRVGRHRSMVAAPPTPLKPMMIVWIHTKLIHLERI